MRREGICALLTIMVGASFGFAPPSRPGRTTNHPKVSIHTTTHPRMLFLSRRSLSSDVSPSNIIEPENCVSPLKSDNQVADIAREAFGSIEFNTELDEATRKLCEKAVSAEFDRVMKEMQEMGEDLKGDTVESLNAMKAIVDSRVQEFEKQNQSLLAYESKVKALTERVRAEAANVEQEAEKLRGYQNQLNSDPFLKLSNFREQPLPKQALLAASLLFFVRGCADALSAVTASNPSAYGETAVVQLGMSIAAMGSYILL